MPMTIITIRFLKMVMRCFGSSFQTYFFKNIQNEKTLRILVVFGDNSCQQIYK